MRRTNQPIFECLECGRKFKTRRTAERAADVGCPKCGGVDIDIDDGYFAITYSSYGIGSA